MVEKYDLFSWLRLGGGDLGYTHSGDLNPMEGVSATLQQLTLRIGCKWEPCVFRMPYSLHVRHLAQVGPLNKFDGSGRWLIKWQSFSALSTLPPHCNLISIHKPSKHHLLPTWFITCKTSLKIPSEAINKRTDNTMATRYQRGNNKT